jgi:hypothetical protein
MRPLFGMVRECPFHIGRRSRWPTESCPPTANEDFPITANSPRPVATFCAVSEVFDHRHSAGTVRVGSRAVLSIIERVETAVATCVDRSKVVHTGDGVNVRCHVDSCCGQ